MGEYCKKPFLTVKDIQEILGIGRSQAYNLIKERIFPVIKVGRLYRIPTVSFLEWAKGQIT